jgi:hypothetical protein
MYCIMNAMCVTLSKHAIMSVWIQKGGYKLYESMPLSGMNDMCTLWGKCVSVWRKLTGFPGIFRPLLKSEFDNQTRPIVVSM